jgi:hypothetical protein
MLPTRRTNGNGIPNPSHSLPKILVVDNERISCRASLASYCRCRGHSLGHGRPHFGWSLRPRIRRRPTFSQRSRGIARIVLIPRLLITILHPGPLGNPWPLPRPMTSTRPLVIGALQLRLDLTDSAIGVLAALPAPPAWHTVHRLNWQCRHQAWSRWYHQCTRLARDGEIAQVS